MPKKPFTAEQIIAALREAESGVPIVEVCRRFGVTETTFFRLRKQFAGMAIAELRRIALGHSNQEISREMQISVKTVETHKASAMAKLGLANRAALVRFAVAHGWLNAG